MKKLLIFLVCQIASAQSFEQNTLGLQCTTGQVPSWSNGYFSACAANAGGGGGSGTVTSVGLSAPTWLTVGGSPVTTSGTLGLTATTGLTANQVLATPNGTTGALTPRALVATDVPNLPVAQITGAAPLASPTFTGTPAAPTASAGDSTTKVATTAFVATSFAPLDSPTFTTSVKYGNCHIDPTPGTATCSSASTLDLSTHSAWIVSLTGNCTITVSNPQAGCAYWFEFDQDATGSRTLTLPATFSFTTAPTFSTTANKADIVTSVYNSTATKYRSTASIGY